MNRLSLSLLATFLVILLGSGIVTYVLRDRSAPAGVNTTKSKSESSAAASETATENEKRADGPLMGQPFGPDYSGLSPNTYIAWEAAAARIALRFSLAAFLAALLAFRPRRGFAFTQRNPYVAQTQILMGVVAAAMMMVVGDSAAR